MILGAPTVDQLRDNLATTELVLADDERARLDDVSAPQRITYPYDLIEQMNADRTLGD